jgi:hypothetical protein
MQLKPHHDSAAAMAFITSAAPPKVNGLGIL